MAKFYLPDIIRNPTTALRPLSQDFGYQINLHNIPAVWAETQGEGVVVAVTDTGCQLDHQDLVGSFIRKTEEDITDAHGHGSHVIGTITANNNDLGIVGVAPKAEIIVKKVLNDEGWGTEEMVANGIHAAIEEGADIISMSLGSSESSQLIHEAIKLAYSKNIVVVCAAGNSGDIGQLDYPGRYAETISVGALDRENIRAGFSNTGPNLDFMAPGVDILSTVPTNAYASYSGSSMACPWIAAIIALIISKHRKYGGKTPVDTVEEIREHLKRTAIDLAEAERDDFTGFGLVDVAKAISELDKEPVMSVTFNNLPEDLKTLKLKVNGKDTNILNIEGNIAEFEFVERAQLTVSSIQPDVPGRDRENLAEEWIELKNIASVDANIGNYYITDNANHVFVIPANFTLPTGQSVKIRTGSGSNDANNLYWNSKTPIWNNTKDVITVTDHEGNVVLQYVYDLNTS